ncbi:MAG: glutamyl-tRNA reductase [Limisphaerales bacterium]
MPIVCAGLSHHTAPVDVRERFAFPDHRVPAVVEGLRARGLADEAVVLSTCNRVELYAVTAEPAALRDFLVEGRAAGAPPAPGELYVLAEPASIEHLFRVASGLDSMVLGETEILGQAKHAYDLALRHGHTGPRLNRLFQRAFQVAKHLRTETSIQRGAVSVASVAVELAEKIFDALSGREVMVLGAGDTSEKAARALLSRGARSVIVSNRSYDRAARLAAELGGRAVHFDDWADDFPRVDIIVSSTAAPGHVIDVPRLAPLLPARAGRPLLLVDIAVPRDVDPAVAQLPDVYLYNIDDLQAIADDHLSRRRAELAACERIIRERAQALLAAGGARAAENLPAGLGEALRG